MGLTEYLERMEPELKNVSNLFGLPESVWEGEFTWTVRESDGSYLCRMQGLGRAAELSAAIPPEEADGRLQELHRKRAARRLCKSTAYALCKKVTGIHPPWGSSTGVRPTHLMREALALGQSPEEAEQTLIREFDFRPEKAALMREIVAVQDRLPLPEDRFADVYIGIPFCNTRCSYCSFSSGEIGNGKLVPPYLAALKKEMEACAGLLRDSGKTLRALYVGGGTPTSLNEEDFGTLLDWIFRYFPGAGEYTVEAGRPDSITRRKLETIRDHGVGRISINPQSMVNDTLVRIGRNHTAEDIEAAYDLAREVGIHHINMDVIAGLPGEGPEEFRVTMEAAKRLKPESLTVHTLAIKRSSRLALEGSDLPAGEPVERMVDMGRETARALGLEPYYLYRQKHMAGNLENVGYALPGHACLYNVDIMEENTHILALGAGGISKRVFPEEGHIQRAPNVANIREYTDRVEEMIQRKRELFLKQ